jgi:hypothetical protein
VTVYVLDFVYLLDPVLTAQAYVCLRLFFDLSKTMLDLKSEGQIVIRNGSPRIKQDLRLLFPTPTGDRSNQIRESVFHLPSQKTEADGQATLRIRLEEFGPLCLPRTKRGWGKRDRDIATWLAMRTIKSRPELGSMGSSLRLYYLWRTLEWSCDDIEALLPHPQITIRHMELCRRWHWSNSIPARRFR